MYNSSYYPGWTQLNCTICPYISTYRNKHICHPQSLQNHEKLTLSDMVLAQSLEQHSHILEMKSSFTLICPNLKPDSSSYAQASPVFLIARSVLHHRCKKRSSTSNRVTKLIPIQRFRVPPSVPTRDSAVTEGSSCNRCTIVVAKVTCTYSAKIKYFFP